MGQVLIHTKKISSIQGAGDAASILSAAIPARSQKPDHNRLFIKDGLFPSIAFSLALRDLAKYGLKQDQLDGVDFEGKLPKAIKQHIKNRAELVLGKEFEVRHKISLNKCKKTLKKAVKKDT